MGTLTEQRAGIITIRLHGKVAAINGTFLRLCQVCLPYFNASDYKHRLGSPGLAASFLYLINCGLPGVEANLFIYKDGFNPGLPSIAVGLNKISIP